MNTTTIAIGLVVLAPIGVACSKTTGDETRAGAESPGPPANATMGTLILTSSAFAESGAIPSRFTCEGEDVSPALAWSDPPAGTKSLALLVDDPDAPDPSAPKTTFGHWVLYDLAPATRGLPEGMKLPPQGARDGKNDFDAAGYKGPCPPTGRHRYVFKVYALDVVLPDLGNPKRTDLQRAMKGHVLAFGQLVGTYEKARKPET